jgi:hypothetical protein
MSYQTLPGVPASDMGPPWYCAIRKDGIKECEVFSFYSLSDAEAKAARIARLLNEDDERLLSESDRNRILSYDEVCMNLHASPLERETALLRGWNETLKELRNLRSSKIRETPCL